MHALAARLRTPALVGLGAAGVCAFVAWADPTTPGGVIPPCPTYTLLGIYCPGCGTSRMLYSLLHLDVASALHYNALGVAAVVLLAGTYVLWVGGRLRGTPMPRWDRYRWSPHIVLVAVTAWFVVRNIPVAPFTALRI
ncbi:DUF2752 domain-containing protein [Rhodococcus sp. (in: high G+C Gram-positive bacteria)]|uniref:DUF2752 domain-containing protein n=1 Tax=Rhodococcus TaxID=1827 RepID=UPI00257DBDAE|nr:DUF2752 domain-containing protein [Rhodococcus sp. (in: high G+C Gram-positive bacteria)]